jgi:hypothetical protein
MAIKPRSAKAKGRAFEKSVAARIAEWLGMTEDDVRSVAASVGGEDVELTERARRLFNYYVECKNHRNLKLPEWIRQARAGAAKANKGAIPIVVFKQHGDGTPYVTIELDFFLELATRHLNYQEQTNE